jgi:hypothetical protein
VSDSLETFDAPPLEFSVPGGRVRITQQVQVTPDPPPPPPPPAPTPYAYSFRAAPPNILRGEETVLSFSAPPEAAVVYIGDQVVTFDRDAAGIIGYVTRTPELTSSYLLRVQDANGKELASRELVVVVVQPLAYSIVAIPDEIPRGEAVRVEYSTPPEAARLLRNGAVYLPPEGTGLETRGERGVLGYFVDKPDTLTTYRVEGQNGYSQCAVMVEQPPAPQPVERLLRKENLAYIGSFRLPVGYQPGTSKFGFPPTPGNSLAYARDSKTLVVSGFAQEGKVSEVEIPELADIRAGGYMALSEARMVQPFGDPTDGRYGRIGPLGGSNGYNVGGMLVDEARNRLLLNGYHYYDASHLQKVSLYASGRDFQVLNDVRGPAKIGNLRCGYTTGYMANIPAKWQAALKGEAIAGMFGMSIISRTSYGPAAFAFNPIDMQGETEVPATPLLYYPPEFPLGPYDQQDPLHNGSSKPGGAVIPSEFDSILFFYRHGTGPFVYRYENIAPPYVSQVLAYRLADLAAAAAGQVDPWKLRPYDVWQFDFPTNPVGTEDGVYILGVAYDPVRQWVFLQQNGWERCPIHVYELRG